MPRFLLLLFVFGFGALSHAETVVLGLRPIAPYVVVSPSGQFSGLEFEIIQAALAARGHTVKPQSMPLARLVESFKSGLVDAAAPVRASHNAGGTLSAVYLVYHNVAWTLASTGLQLRSPADLADHSIVAFQTASRVLGPAFTAAVHGNPEYREESQQLAQIRMLFSSRTEVIIGDSRIFTALSRSPEVGLDTTSPVRSFELFDPSPYSVAFRDPRMADEFNKGLAVIRANGVYDRLIAAYP